MARGQASAGTWSTLAQEIRRRAVAPVAAKFDCGYAGLAHLLPSPQALKAVVRAILPASLVAHLVRQHRASVGRAHAVHVLQHHAAAGHLRRVGRAGGAALRRPVRNHHLLLLPATAVVYREGGTRPVAEGEANEAVVRVEVLQAPGRVLVAAVAMPRPAGAADDVVHAGMLDHVLAVVVAGDVERNAEPAQQGVELAQDLSGDAVAAGGVHRVVAEGHLPVRRGTLELGLEPGYLLLLSAVSQDLPGLAGAPVHGGVDVEHVDGQPGRRRVARLVPEVRHPPPPTRVLGMAGEVSLRAGVRVPVVVPGDNIPRPAERAVPQVDLPPPADDEPRVPLGAVAVDVVPDGVDGDGVDACGDVCQRRGHLRLAVVPRTVVPDDEHPGAAG
mmetsp:Transcript_51922/g.161099  ORF Transcript_51922/g.161099 Transcript_51922/m.161099 type:complete len:387 (-) Transcript_51922:326-1486(-)